MTHGLDYFLPVNPLMRIASQATGLWLLAMLPIWILDAWSFRKTYKTFSYKAILSALLWLLWAIVFVLLVSNQ